MRTLIALALGSTLACLTGCVMDGVEAAVTSPVAKAVAAEAPAPAGQQLYTMFPEEKARAQVAELPAQF